MVTSWPKGLPGLGTGAERLAANITAMSGGRLTVKVYAAGELVPALECFGAVANGTAQMGHDAGYYHTGKSEGCAFFTAFPFGFTMGEMAAWIKHGNGQKLWDELYAPFGLRAFQAGSTGTQMFGWFRREIRSLADLQRLEVPHAGQPGPRAAEARRHPCFAAGRRDLPGAAVGCHRRRRMGGAVQRPRARLLPGLSLLLFARLPRAGSRVAAHRQRAGLALAHARTAGDRADGGRCRDDRHVRRVHRAVGPRVCARWCRSTA